MNIHHAKCTTRVLLGRVQASLGRMLGSRQQQTKGLMNQMLGHADRVLARARAQPKRTHINRMG
jgi:hypothetical protein